ncbi:class I SAM-dependent methyltransferase [Streptomyces poonensis]|uniref:SAM-dependent methyltransferase n=1 Tax=Streptomyces poonensis TaxID=68255 RepID=A0A918PIS8_9ACTN|nr:methyltransferase domain-containing protein [Streptomyces poonensis]GGZ09194.1 SAM-dependent methyltransferase [Streptomyces poonensis]GLJ93842.1 SAM-dependent methyltransferase [Streptomyces poonensis]
MGISAERTPDAGALAEEIFNGLRTALEVFAVDVGVRRGLYRALAAHGPLTPRELSKTAAVHDRYAREWLEQQAVAGILTVSGPDTEGGHARRYELPAEHRRVLVDQEDPLYLATGPQFIVSIAGALPELLEAFGTGAGVPYERYGRGTREGIAGLNRPLYRPETVRSWVTALPDVHRRLADAPHGRVLDLGCGLGWSTIALARAFPAARLTGIDLDAASVEEARRNAREAGLGGRVSFARADAAGVRPDDPVDLVTVFEALHDMADPVGALAAVRGLLAPSGAVLVADEKVSEEFTAPGSELDRLNYAFSVLHCLPATRAEGARVEAGTVLRPDMVRAYAREAGYGAVEVLDIEHDLWRFYRITP